MRPSLALALLITGALPALAASVRVDEIVWLSGEPVTAEPTDRAESSLTDALIAFMTKQWPEVRHRVVHANARRAWQMMAQGDLICQISSVRTPEREQLAYFTDTLMGPPLQLIVRRDKLAALPRKPGGEVDLARLLADTKLRGALVDGRSYGPVIDGLLAQRPKANKSISFYASSDSGSQIVPMLSLGRADYSIGYDVSLAREDAGQQGAEKLVSQAIAGASEPVRAGVACPRNAWGLAAIEGIDKALGSPAGAALLRAEAERWLTPEARQRYGPQIAAFYRERAKRSVIR